jgi:hypothetical protein
MKRISFLVAALLLLTIDSQLAPAFAQGTAFTYQGRLNSTGAPVSGNYDVVFALYNDPLLGDQVGAAVTNSAVSVMNGLFTTTVDFGAAPWTGQPLYLELLVRTNGSGALTLLSPRQPVTPSPYAIFATSASNVSGTISATQISGPVGSANLAGTYGSAVAVTNGNNTFNGNYFGNGASVTNVNAAVLGGLPPSGFWQLGGNTVSSGQFIGSVNDIPLEFEVDNVPALRLIPDGFGYGAPNVVGGSQANFAGGGAFGSVIGGGGAMSYVGSPTGNSVYGWFGVVGGGAWNTNYANWGTLGGGSLNTIGDSGSTFDGEVSTVCGGQENLANGYCATVVGGIQNQATGVGAFVGGGGADIAYNYGNNASGISSVVGGGEGNTASGTNSTIPGGYANLASGKYSFAAGQNAQAQNQGAFVWADSQSSTFSSTANNQFLIRAAGGVGINTTTPSSTLEVNGDTRIDGNRLLLLASSGGTNDGLGYGTGDLPRIGAAGPFLYGYTGGALGAIGPNTICLSWDASGNVAVSNNLTTASLNVRTASSLLSYVGIGTAANPSYLLKVGSGGAYCNGTTWVNGSDRNTKQNFDQVDPREVLAKVSALPITEWQYKLEDADTKHIGPMAQDFHAAFGLNGSDDKHISTVDEGGVALAAIQGLNQKLAEKDAQIQNLEKKLDDLQAMVKQLAEQK